MEKTSVLVLAALAAGLLSDRTFAAQSENGVEKDGETVSSAYRHLKVTAWTLRDRTDTVGELVSSEEWLLLPRTAPFALAVPAVDVADVVRGTGTVYLRMAPLPGSRDWTTSDFGVVPGSSNGVEVLESPADCLRIPYEGGALGRQRALITAQRRLRPYVPGRDGLFLSNTWGDRNRDARMCEDFILKEIDAAAELGIEVLQLDDGWQKGRTANSSAANGSGVWDGYWAADPEFWEPDPVRFPNGFRPIVGRAAAKGVKLGLWFGPDSSNDAANWERDADLILRHHRDYGIDNFKIDSLKTRNGLALKRQRKLFDKVLKESGGRVVFDLDITAERRPGYFGLPEIGPVFVENRYTDWHKYWPHQTLRQFWSLAQVVDPVRLRMEVLNLRRHADCYVDDPLAPTAWPVESVFATVMLASPLGWFEARGLESADVARLAPFVATWKRHRDRMNAGVTYPVGNRPDGVSWTGFVTVAADGVYALFFRELSDAAEFSFDLNPYLGGFGGNAKVETLSPRGKSSLANGMLVLSVPDKLDFIWVKVTPR